MKATWQRLLAVLILAGCSRATPPCPSCPPCEPPRDAAPPASTALLQSGKTSLVRRKNDLVLRVERKEHVEETTLEDAPIDRVRLVELDGDDAPDVVVDRGEASRAGTRFRVYLTEGDLGVEDPLLWRWTIGAKSLDGAVHALSAIERIDYSIPQVCGMLSRASAPVEAWRWSEESGWSRQATARRPPRGACTELVPDGDQAYWMPELKCSRIAPACEFQLLSGGHGGTQLPQESYVFFDRVKGKLELRAFAENNH